MEDAACSNSENRATKKAGPQVFPAPTAPNHSPIKGGSRMADYSPHNNRDCGDSLEKSANWKSVGALAADLVRKAVQQQDAAE